MDFQKCKSSSEAPSLSMVPLSFSNKLHERPQCQERNTDHIVADVDIDLREVYFLIMHFLSAGPCQKTFGQFWNELLEHELLPRRYHAWYSRSGACSGDENDNGFSFPLGYNNLVERYPHIGKDHLVKLLKQLMLNTAPPLHGEVGGNAPSAVDVPTLLGTGSFSLLDCHKKKENKQVKPPPDYLRWPHMQADQVRGLSLREIGGGFTKHHRAPSIRSACYAIAKPSTMVQRMQNMKKLRGHRDAVYCGMIYLSSEHAATLIMMLDAADEILLLDIKLMLLGEHVLVRVIQYDNRSDSSALVGWANAIFDRSGRYVITGSDDRLVKIWSMETAFCLASCRGHEGDITDLAVSSNNVLVASASNDFIIRVWRLPDGLPISVLRGHTGAVTAIAFSPRPSSVYQLLSSSDDGSCRIWDARFSQCSPRIYLPKPPDAVAGKNSVPSMNGTSSSNGPQSHQILCCAFNASGTVFVTGSSDTFARVWSACKSSTDDSEQPNHEIDVLSGHENDVNYVQFSACAGASRSSVSDTFKEESLPKFKNSWFCHDNIVTCSRDGSAIIWIPRSRRYHGKVGRWTRAYHLKVPPPPMPPQPPRGGPRQRLLPTPRGVNMIVWSLDNRFVLAAIMGKFCLHWDLNLEPPTNPPHSFTT
ncbi:PH-interacting protein [Vitis vinifera]|uniref:PH-interacting protein n=1 Tax=Vitis vinifera TaxID=29760 RepID=A0A438IY13_VITVI|nr:PH-interacting protein [Vitis vinifera]